MENLLFVLLGAALFLAGHWRGGRANRMRLKDSLWWKAYYQEQMEHYKGLFETYLMGRQQEVDMAELNEMAEQCLRELGSIEPSKAATVGRYIDHLRAQQPDKPKVDPDALAMALSNIPEMVDYRMAACAKLGIPNQMDQFGVPNVYPLPKVRWDGKPPGESGRDFWFQREPGKPPAKVTYYYTFICDEHGEFEVLDVDDPTTVKCPECEDPA